MSKFDKIAVLNKIGSTGMVPVFYHKDAEVAKKVEKACYDGGVRAFGEICGKRVPGDGYGCRFHR